MQRCINPFSFITETVGNKGNGHIGSPSHMSCLCSQFEVICALSLFFFFFTFFYLTNLVRKTQNLVKFLPVFF